MWLARNEDGRLFLYIDKPELTKSGFYLANSDRESLDFVNTDVVEVSVDVSKLFSEITWEDGPVELIIPKYWVARDQDGTLWMFNEEPIRNTETNDWEGHGYGINEKLFPEVTWDNSPKRV